MSGGSSELVNGGAQECRRSRKKRRAALRKEDYHYSFSLKEKGKLNFRKRGSNVTRKEVPTPAIKKGGVKGQKR